MSNITSLIENNKKWVASKKDGDPAFFDKLAQGQSPDFLWIGCSDSRVPPASITGLNPGDVFVHRNVANLVLHTDLNLLSVVQYAVEVLKVKDIIICGHYGCGGVQASLGIQAYGLADNWIRNIRDVFLRHKAEILKLKDLQEKTNRLVELNTIHQAHNLCYSNIIQKAWFNKMPLSIHAWVFDLKSGYIKDLNHTLSSLKDIDDVYQLDLDSA